MDVETGNRLAVFEYVTFRIDSKSLGGTVHLYPNWLHHIDDDKWYPRERVKWVQVRDQG